MKDSMTWWTETIAKTNREYLGHTVSPSVPLFKSESNCCSCSFIPSTLSTTSLPNALSWGGAVFLSISFQIAKKLFETGRSEGNVNISLVCSLSKGC